MCTLLFSLKTSHSTAFCIIFRDLTAHAGTVVSGLWGPTTVFRLLTYLTQHLTVSSDEGTWNLHWTLTWHLFSPRYKFSWTSLINRTKWSRNLACQTQRFNLSTVWIFWGFLNPKIDLLVCFHLICESN